LKEKLKSLVNKGINFMMDWIEEEKLQTKSTKKKGRPRNIKPSCVWGKEKT